MATRGAAGHVPIEDHGVVGDLHTVALVGKDGSIDFLCFPHFDSPTIFASLLDPERGGSFRIAPCVDGAVRRQLYLPDSNVLVTRTQSPDGIAEVTDFMPVEEVGYVHSLVRQARAVRGEIPFEMSCAPRFDHARARHRTRRDGNDVIFESEGADRTAVRLRSSVPLSVRDGDAVARFTLGAGSTADFCLEEAGVPGTPGASRWAGGITEAFESTRDYWRRWIGRCRYVGRWREMVHRSALTLKLLTSQEHGSLVAAPTFGLPEHVGGTRNWDYRYTWIRDSAFTLYAFLRLGYTDEAQAFMRWLEARCDDQESGALQIVYRLDGGKDLPERELTHLSGYLGSRPVRIGNAAVDQLQLDIYGELLDTVYLSNKYAAPISYSLWERLVRILDHVCEAWNQPDEGIWEVRGGRKEFLSSRVMCWVALDRGLRLAAKRSFPAPVDRWTEQRDAIFRDVFARFWSEERQAFVQHPGSSHVDAAALLLPLLKFVGPTDPRWISTLDAISRDLAADSLVFRYLTPDGLPGEEGTFTACSFWYVECLARAGRLDEARLHFEKMLGYANHLGLYAEELGLHGEHLGNFPQAFTHLALISAAWNLDAALDGAGWSA